MSLTVQRLPKVHAALLAVLAIVLAPQLGRGSVVVDFEAFADSESVTSQIPGISVSNGIILISGISLNEFDFPPHSGAAVISDAGGPITILFQTPVRRFSAYFTYATQVSLVAFDELGQPVNTAVSSFSNNLAFSGESGSFPNEQLATEFPLGIRSVILAGDSAGGSFASDDWTFEPVPEPKSICLFLTAFGALYAARRQAKAHL